MAVKWERRVVTVRAAAEAEGCGGSELSGGSSREVVGFMSLSESFNSSWTTETRNREKEKKKLQSAVSYKELMLAQVVSLTELLASLSTLFIYLSDSFKDLIHVLSTTAACSQLHSVHSQFSVTFCFKTSENSKIPFYTN